MLNKTNEMISEPGESLVNSEITFVSTRRPFIPFRQTRMEPLVLSSYRNGYPDSLLEVHCQPAISPSVCAGVDWRTIALQVQRYRGASCRFVADLLLRRGAGLRKDESWLAKPSKLDGYRYLRFSWKNSDQLECGPLSNMHLP